MKKIYMLIALLVLLILPTSKQAKAQALCNLAVPTNPLTNLTTPWQLSGCHEADPNAAVFVQAVIFDKDAKSLSTYEPLVIDAGTTPALAPVPFTLPASSDVAIFGGGDDDATTLTGDGATSCTNGADGRIFGQVFFCGTAQFWQDVNAAHLSIPPLGTETDGTPCPSIRSFQIVDQDQSDNVQNTYLVTASGTSAQDTAANRASLGSYTVMKNGSDNRLLSDFVGPAVVCSSWLIPDRTNNGALVPTQATNELQAAAYQASPPALIPAGDPMAGPNNLDMVNAYRANVDQPLIHSLGQANTVPYCAHLRNTAPGFIASHQAAFQASNSPTSGENLYDFLQNRLAASFQLLGCK